MRRVDVFREVADLHAAAAAHITDCARRAVAERGRFLLVLAGGGTPRDTYRLLASTGAERIRCPQVHVFWGDERCVPPDHEASNFRLAAESLLRHLPIPDSGIHRVRGEEPPGRAAALYDRELRDFFGAARPADLSAGEGFDLVLLGVGADGHTASLFPGSPALEASGWAVAASAPDGVDVPERVTLTLPAINRAREVLFLARGPDKRAAVATALAGSGASPPLPAGRVAPDGSVRWLLDGEAAAGIDHR